MAGQIERRVASPPASGSMLGAGVSSGSTIDSTGTWIFRSSSLRTPVSTIRHWRRGPTMNRPTSSSGFWVADRPIRWTSLARCLGQPLERQREVGAALGRGDGMDLVDDAPAGALEQRLGAAGQHQVQRLRGGDEDVGRLAQHLLALVLRGVAGAHGHPQIGADSAQRRAQVAVDVVGERLERRDVDEADPPVARVLDGSGSARAGRSRRGTRPASCPSRWARR